MFLKRIALVVAFPLAISASIAGQAPPAVLPSDPTALMTLAQEKNGLAGTGVKPWHIRGTYHAYDAKGKPEYEGVYEEWRLDATHYEVSFTSPKFSQTDYGTGMALLREGTQEWPSGPEYPLRNAVVDPLFDPTLLKEFTLRSHAVDFGKARLQCVAMTYAVRPNVQVTNEFYPTACFEPQIPVLRIYSDGPVQIVRDRLVQFQERYLARLVQVVVGGKVVADMKLDVIESLKEQPGSLLAPPPSAVPVDLTKITFEHATQNRWPMLIKKAVPFYPDDAKSLRIQGTVNLTAVIRPDGHLENPQVIDGPARLRQPAIDAVRQWMYKPFELMGEPRRVVIELHVIFSMG